MRAGVVLVALPSKRRVGIGVLAGGVIPVLLLAAMFFPMLIPGVMDIP